ncbi:hypothetical protein [Robertmurraya siralis]|uniref:hypothetical protein n=1 Tax=Robertmurraya siralis TaxID=77777 RepID=UPI0010FA6313|nr:hypothetical protein [Robertmurraya siralis]
MINLKLNDDIPTIPYEISLFNLFYYGKALNKGELETLKDYLERGIKQVNKQIEELAELEKWTLLGRKYGELQEGDIVYINYGHDVPVGYYEVTFTKDDKKTDIMWLKNDRDGCYNAMNTDFGTAKLIVASQNRFDK